MQEIWEDIKGYKGHYKVSNLGNIKSFKRSKFGKLLKFQITYDGYYVVSLSIRGNQKNFKVHRLVAETFIPNPNNLLEINHKDENKLNNEVENLEWCTRKYNCLYSYNKIYKLSKNYRVYGGIYVPKKF